MTVATADRETACGLQPLVSSPLGSVCYALRTGRGVFLFDTGHPRAAEQTVALLRAEGLLDDLTAIVITHAHADHVGATGLLQRLTGAEVWAGPGRADGRLAEQEQRLGLTPEPYRVDRTLADRELIDLGGETLEVLLTPGHADDHAALYLRGQRTLVAGDLFTFGDVGTFDITHHHTRSLALMIDSVRRCAELCPERVAPGHGPMQRRPRQLLQAAEQRLDYFRRRPLLLAAHTLMPLMLLLIESRNGSPMSELRKQALRHARCFDEFLAGLEGAGIAHEFEKILMILALKGLVSVIDGRVYYRSDALAAAA
jgi:hydroxyacylglutathione hydrolase